MQQVVLVFDAIVLSGSLITAMVLRRILALELSGVLVLLALSID